MRFIACVAMAVAASGCAWYMTDRNAFRGGTRPLQPTPDSQVPTTPGTPSLGPALETLPSEQPHDSLRIPDPATGEFQTRHQPLPPNGRFATSTALSDRWDPAWQILGPSTEQRPLHAFTLGHGPTRVLAITGLDGGDVLSTRLMDLLAETLMRNPQSLSRNKFLLVREVNPDGLTTGQPFNSRGVDLNRNFPSRNYRVDVTQRTGDGPASETETRLLLRALSEFRPQRVVHLTTGVPKPGLACNAAVEKLAARIAGSQQSQVSRLEQTAVPGSLEEYVTGTLQLEMVRVSLPAGNETILWQKYAPTLLTMLTAPADGSDGPWNGLPPDLEHVARATPASQRTARAVGDTEAPNPARPTIPSGYIELPPPPR